MKNTKDEKMDLNEMVKMFKDDLKKSTSTSYDSDGCVLLVVNGKSVIWELYKKHLTRTNWAMIGQRFTSYERVHSFKYNFVFGSYFTWEIVGPEGPVFGMVQIQA